MLEHGALSLPRYFRRSNTLEGIHLVAGDSRQLPAFQHSGKGIHTAMQILFKKTQYFLLLEVQHRHTSNLSALSSHFFYDGEIRSAMTQTSTSTNFRCFVWSKADLMVEEGYSSEESKIVAQQKRNVPQECKALCFYASQRRSLIRQCIDTADVIIVDSCPGD